VAATVFAFSCHPDDIEFMMGGTLFLLKRAGCTLHYMNLANGNCGSTERGLEETAATRRGEAQRAAALLGAQFHESLVGDFEVLYTLELVRRAAAVIREVKPDILLLPSPEDYMEDHMNASRIGVTAAFCRGVPNFASIPPVPATFQDVVLYHALPYGLADGLRRRIQPEFFVDISAVIEDKQAMLACHESQRKWLDVSQGLDSYLATMRDMSAEVGRMSGLFRFAEGWRRHSHLGFSSKEQDPLGELLEPLIVRART
jgi:LmbE family N-acetylglucosaminyl deacetylase